MRLEYHVLVSLLLAVAVTCCTQKGHKHSNEESLEDTAGDPKCFSLNNRGPYYLISESKKYIWISNGASKQLDFTSSKSMAARFMINHLYSNVVALELLDQPDGLFYLGDEADCHLTTYKCDKRAQWRLVPALLTEKPISKHVSRYYYLQSMSNKTSTCGMNDPEYKESILHELFHSNKRDILGISRYDASRKLKLVSICNLRDAVRFRLVSVNYKCEML